MTSNGRATIQNVYDIVNKRFDRLEDKMDRRLVHIETCVDRNTAFRYRILGISGIIGAMAGGAVSLFWEKITGK